METLVAVAISVIVIGPVGAWMVLIFTSQAPAAAGFTDAGQSRLLNTWVTRDVASSEIVVSKDPSGGSLLSCGGVQGSPDILMNLYDLGSANQVVVYGTAPGTGGTSLYRWECDLTVDRNVIDQTEVLRELDSVTATCDANPGCRTVTVAAELDSGHRTSATASRRSSASALLGFGGTSRPVAVITQTSRTERAAGSDLVVGLSAASSWDADPGDTLTHEWSVSGPAAAAISDPTGESTTVSMGTAGEYSVTLTVSDPTGNIGEATIAIPLVNLKPTVEQPVCESTGEPADVGRAFNCAAVAADSDGSVVQYAWSFPIDDTGATGTQAGAGPVRIEFPFEVTATPYVSVVVTDDEGLSAEASVLVPLASVSPGEIEMCVVRSASVCEGPQNVPGLLQRLANTDRSRTARFTTDGANFDRWELRGRGSAAVVAASTPGEAVWEYDFPTGSSGEFTIVRVGADGSEVTRDFRVNAPPTARFDPVSTSAPAPQTLTFGDSSTDDFGVVAQDWDFNADYPGQPQWQGSGSPASVVFSNPGRYAVVLTVRDADGLTATAFAETLVGGTPAQPAPPRWVGDLVVFDRVDGATGYVVSITYTGTETDGTTPCVRPVDRQVPAAGPWEVRPAGNPCANPTDTSAAVAVRAGAATGPSSTEVRKP